MRQRVVNKNRHNRQYSFAEMEFVRDMYPIMSAREIAAQLGRRNPKAIRNLAAELGITKERRWMESEKRTLMHQYGHADLDWLCRRLDRSRMSILKMVQNLGIQKNKTWTAEDDERLRALLPTADLAAVAREFGVTTWAVAGRAKRIGISHVRINRLHPWKKRFLNHNTGETK